LKAVAMAAKCGSVICEANEPVTLVLEFNTFSISPVMPICEERPKAVSATFCRMGSDSNCCAVVAFGAFCLK
jgi:hypothetical protein